MKATVIFLILLTIPHLYFMAFSMWGAAHLRHLSISCGLAAVVYGVGLVTARAVQRRHGRPPYGKAFLAFAAATAAGFLVFILLSPSNLATAGRFVLYVAGVGAVTCGLCYLATSSRGGAPKSETHEVILGKQPEEHAPFLNTKVILVVAGAAAGEFLVMTLLSALSRSQVVLEVGYYAVLALSGVILAAWCRSKKHVPVLTATFVLLLLSALATIMFLTSGGAQFRYGPEITIFAIENHLSRMTMLSLDIAVVLSAWRIAVVLSRRKRASPAHP